MHLNHIDAKSKESAWHKSVVLPCFLCKCTTCLYL